MKEQDLGPRSSLFKRWPSLPSPELGLDQPAGRVIAGASTIALNRLHHSEVRLGVASLVEAPSLLFRFEAQGPLIATARFALRPHDRTRNSRAQHILSCCFPTVLSHFGHNSQFYFSRDGSTGRQSISSRSHSPSARSLQFSVR